MSSEIQRDTLEEVARWGALSPRSDTAEYAVVTEAGVTVYYRARSRDGHGQRAARAWATRIGDLLTEHITQEVLPYPSDDAATIEAALRRVARQGQMILTGQVLERTEAITRALARIGQLAPAIPSQPVPAADSELVEQIAAALTLGAPREEIVATVNAGVAAGLAGLSEHGLAPDYATIAGDLWCRAAEQRLDTITPAVSATAADLLDAATAAAEATARERAALARRDEAIRAAVAAGVPRSTIQRITGVTKGRISQITTSSP